MVDYSTLSIVFTGLSISIAAFYYILTLRNTQKNQQLQLETRQAQLFMQMYNRADDALHESFNHIMRIEYRDFRDYWEKYGPDSDDDMSPHIRQMAYFLEGLGVLVKERLLSMRLVALT